MESNTSLVNATLETEEEPDSTMILAAVCVLVLTGISATLIVIITILRSPRIKLRQQGFIVSLAFADLIFLGVVMPFVLASIANNYAWVLGDAACAFVGYLSVTCVQASAANICLIAFNRYFSIVHFQHYKSFFTKRNMILMLLVAWLYPALVGLPSFFGFGQFIYLDYVDICMYDWSFSLAHRVYVGVMGFIIPLLFTAYFYIHILIAVLRSKRKMKRNTGGNAQKIKKEDIRLTIQLIFIFTWFLFCWAPFLITAIIIDPNGELDRLVYDITVNLMVMNFVLNPFVYFFSNKTLRQEVRVLMCCQGDRRVQDMTTGVSHTGTVGTS